MRMVNLDKVIQWEKEQLKGSAEAIPDVVRSRLDKLYAQIESDSPSIRPVTLSRKQGKRIWYGAVIAATVTVIAGLTLVASASVSPTMAEALKQVPLVGSVFKMAGDLGLQTADEKGLAAAVDSSDTHQGITLHITQVMFDGARLAIALEREGASDQTPPLQSEYVDGQKLREDLLESVDIIINGKSTLSNQGAFSMLTWGPGKDDQSVIVQYSGNPIGVEQPNLDHFQLNVQASLKGIEEKFNMETRVKKLSANNVILTPAAQKNNDFVCFSVDRIEVTPITINVITTLTQVAKTEDLPAQYRRGPIMQDPVTHKPKTRVYLNSLDYDLVDDQGHTVKMLSGNGQTGSTTIPAKMSMSFTPFAGTPRTITVKPFFRRTGAGGQPVEDAHGNWIKDFLPELEMTIPVTPSSKDSQ